MLTTVDLAVAAISVRLVDRIGRRAFWLCAVINAIAFAFVQRFVPETRGRSPEVIGHALRAGTFRAMR
jgi:major inositol transporter-like SP family MFS transporter